MSNAASSSFQITHRAVLAIAVPMMLANLSTPLLGLVDTAVIGRLGQAHLLGAVAVGSVLFSFLFWGFGFLRMGTIGLAAQALGAGDEDELAAVLWRALLMAAAFGALIITLQWPLKEAMFAFMAAPPEVEAEARTYVSIRIWSAPLAFANFVLLGWFLGRGSAGIALVLQLVLNVANIVLNVWFVMGMGLGVAGLALGTVLAEGAALLVAIPFLMRALGFQFRFDLKRVSDLPAFWRTMAVNRDIFIRTFALVFAIAFFTRAGGQEGEVALAANAILLNLFLTAGHFLDGAAAAAEQLGGRSLGARNRAAFREALRLSVLWGMAMAAALALLYWLAGPAIIAFLTTAEAVRVRATHDLAWAALTPITGVLAFQLDGLFIGATWTAAMRDMMLISLGIYLAAWWALSEGMGLGNTGLWAAFNAFLLLRGLTLALAYRGQERRSFPQIRKAKAA